MNHSLNGVFCIQGAIIPKDPKKNAEMFFREHGPKNWLVYSPGNGCKSEPVV
jgi:hypothetical protein